MRIYELTVKIPLLGGVDGLWPAGWVYGRGVFNEAGFFGEALIMIKYFFFVILGAARSLPTGR
jgi:hypothetical protein